MGKLPQLDVEVKPMRCLSSAHPLPSVELAERAYEAEPLRLPPDALSRRTVFLTGTESGSNFKTSRVLGAKILRELHRSTRSTIPYNALGADSSALSPPPVCTQRTQPREKNLSRLYSAGFS